MAKRRSANDMPFPISRVMAYLRLSEETRDAIAEKRRKEFDELAQVIGYVNAAFRLGYTPGDKVNDSGFCGYGKGRPSRLTLLSRAINLETTKARAWYPNFYREYVLPSMRRGSGYVDKGFIKSEFHRLHGLGVKREDLVDRLDKELARKGGVLPHRKTLQRILRDTQL